MLQKRSLELHTPQWGTVVRVPEGNSTTLNYTGLAYPGSGDYLHPTFRLYVGNPGNLSYVPDSKLTCKRYLKIDLEIQTAATGCYGVDDSVLVSYVDSTDDPRLSTYSIAAESLDAWTFQSACNYKLQIEDDVTDAIAYSAYFTIIKANDTGINATTLCPKSDGSLARFSDICRFVPNKSICTRSANEVYRP